MQKTRVHGCFQRLGTSGAILVLASCTTTVSRLHPYGVPPQSLRVAEVVTVATRQQIVATGSHYKLLVDSGISDSDIRDGSLAVARVYCCDGPPERDWALWFYVPSGTSVEIGDIVEVKMGRAPGAKGADAVNTAVRVRQKGHPTGAPCRWVPPDSGLWMRVLYCDWMEQEGWVKQEGSLLGDRLIKTWLKPAAETQLR